MKYILVLQWPISSISGYDSMIAIENLMTSALSQSNRIDGHDVGSGETNIFIETEDPHGLYGEVRSALGSHPAWSDIRVAYRKTDGDEYTVLWPENLREFDVR